MEIEISFPNPEAVERSRQTIHAMELFHDKARAIARVCGEAGANDTVLAVVERNLIYGGAWPVPCAELSQRVESLDNGGWVLTFAQGTSVEEVENRCLELARLSFKRWEAIRRWASLHA